jgi:DNA polymerase-3 subunit gamma/tau
MAVLYRKYRPQTFAQVVGQKAIIKTLKNQIAGGAFAHAYLFIGSRGVGKTSVARIFAKSVNCLNNQPSLSALSAGHLPPDGEKNNVQASPGALGDACGECSVCKAIENNNFIDLIEIDAASNTGVDNVRDIIDHVKFSPTLGKFKVFIIDEVHMLSKGAFNALLKTLEEPPKHAIFILATTEIQKVPATIISRTQRFDFKAYSAADIKEHLKNIVNKENLSYPEEVLDLVAQNAGGGMRDALSILDKISTLGNSASLGDIRTILGITDTALLAELTELISEGKANEIPEYFDSLLEAGVDFNAFNKDFLEHLRVLMVKKITGQAEGVLQNLSINEIIFIIRLFLKSFKDLQTAPSPEIPLLLAAIEGALKKKPNSVTQAIPKEKTVVTEQPIIKIQNQEAIKPDLEPQSEILSQLDQNVSLKEVLDFWPKVVLRIKDKNGPLGSLLKAAQIIGVNNGKIIISVKYQFDKKTIEKNLNFITQEITEVSGKNLGIVGELPDKITEGQNPVAVLSDALKIFGGEIIE